MLQDWSISSTSSLLLGSKHRSVYSLPVESAEAWSNYAPRLLAAGVASNATGVSATDSMLSGTQWSGTVTYSFPASPYDYEAGYSEAASGFAQVSFAQMQAARYALEGTSRYTGGPRMALTSIENFTNVSLVDDGFSRADIRIGQSNTANPTAYAYLPSSDPLG